MTALGTHKKKYMFSCVGIVEERDAVLVAERIVYLAGMTPARPGRIDSYPFNGKGGEGYTYFQPLCESYLVMDVYTDIRETEVLLSTCKPDRINLDTLRNYLSCQVGEVKEIGVL